MACAHDLSNASALATQTTCLRTQTWQGSCTFCHQGRPSSAAQLRSDSDSMRKLVSQSLPYFERLIWCRSPTTRHCQLTGWHETSIAKREWQLRRLSAASATCESQQFRTVPSRARVLRLSESVATVLPEVLPFSLQAGQTPVLVSAMACTGGSHSCPRLWEKVANFAPHARLYTCFAS